MSEIEIKRVWEVDCMEDDCTFSRLAETAVGAEQDAIEHIAQSTSDGEGDSHSNYSHTLEIRCVTMVGRQI